MKRNSSSFTIYCDGASRGNPGQAGVGIVIYKAGKLIKEVSAYIGLATNNVAEYTALIYALEEVLNLGVERVTLLTDSQLVARQLNRQYKIKDRTLNRLAIHVDRLAGKFNKVEIKHMPRNANRRANKLASSGARAGN